MSYIVLYFSIGVALAVLVYLYSCYDYRVNCRDWSWDKYTNTNDTYQIIAAFCIIYPFIILVLACAGLWWCLGYLAEYIREWIFKIIDQHFVK